MTDPLIYNEVISDLKALISSQSAEEDRTKLRRSRRKVDVDPSWLRKADKLAKDFAFVPLHVIDTALNREQPVYINFLKAERRIAIFKTQELLNGQKPDVQELESNFTAGMTYAAWEVPFVRCQDGGALHGWDSVEVVFDASRPYHVGIEHIGHDNLIFSKDATDIQNCPNVLRRYKFTRVQLKRAVAKFGFNPEQVALLMEKNESGEEQEKVIELFKRFFRVDDVVHVAWFTNDGACTDWIKAPEPLFVGIKDKVTSEVMVPDPMTGMMMPVPQEEWINTPLQNYPLFVYRYRITEEDEIFGQRGRGDLDKDIQEAQIATTSAFVTGCLRACHTFASPNTDIKGSRKIEKLESTILEDGGIYDVPLTFFNRPFPDAGMLKATQHLASSHAAESSQVNFAVNNREDSRKTATEIQAANQQSSALTGVQVTMFSIFLRDVWGFVWQIVQSRCLQGHYVLVPLYDETGQVVLDELGKPVNNDALVSLTYDIRAAGDFDVIQRAEKLDRMSKFLPFVQGTAAQQVIIGDMLALAFPEDADKYRSAAMQIPMMQQLMQQLGGIVQQLAAGEQDPQRQEMFKALMQQMQQAL